MPPPHASQSTIWVDLPIATAVWVLTAHLVTLLSPLLISWAVQQHHAFLLTVMNAPKMLHVAAGLMMFGSAFEILQNSLDRWYLSTESRSLFDGLFGTCICFALATVVVACFGDQVWVRWAAYTVAASFPTLYVLGGPVEIIRGTLGAASVGSLYWTLTDPVVLLSFVSVFLTVFFFRLLMKTRAQSLHGATTLVNVLSALVIPWAIVNTASGTPMPWWQVLMVAAGLVGVALVAYPRLSNLPATPRRAIS